MNNLNKNLENRKTDLGRREQPMHPRGAECSGIGPLHKQTTPSLAETYVLVRRGAGGVVSNRVYCYKPPPG